MQGGAAVARACAPLRRGVRAVTKLVRPAATLATQRHALCGGAGALFPLRGSLPPAARVRGRAAPPAPAAMTTRAVEEARTRHLRTLHAVFAHPTTHTLRWRDALSMLESLGASRAATSHNKEKIELAGHTHFIARPHGGHNHGEHACLAAPEVLSLRKFLAAAGFAPPDACARDAAPPAETTGGHAPETPAQRQPERVPPESLDGRHVLAVVGHAEARLYWRHGVSSVPPALLHPRDWDGTQRHLHHKATPKHQATPTVHGDRMPTLDTHFAKSLIAALQPAHEIILAGHGAGKGCASDALLVAMEAHAPALAKRVVHRMRLSEGHVTDNELCAQARAFYNARHDAEAQAQADALQAALQRAQQQQQ